MEIFAQYPASLWLLAVLIALFAGVIKGIVGFAMPMILVSGLAAFLPPETVVAALIIPTLVTNLMQAMRQGVDRAAQSIRQFSRFLLVGAGAMVIAAQFVMVLPQKVFFLLIGLPITVFVVMQYFGWMPANQRQSATLDVSVGLLAGVMGGLSGIWGPPTVSYLTALNTPKAVQVQIQGVIYGLGAVLLTFSHIGSGVLTSRTIWLSIILTVPAVIGMAAGTAVQDRIDQTAFRRATLLVLLLAGFNLVRRGLIN